MKKIALSLLCGVLMGSFVMPVMAQELTQKRKATTFSPTLMAGGDVVAAKKVLPQNARTMILRFEPGQMTLSDVQKEMLITMTNQLNKSYGGRISLVAASKNENDSLLRATKVRDFLEVYTNKAYPVYIRLISPEYVVPSVDNTVKITINR